VIPDSVQTLRMARSARYARSADRADFVSFDPSNFGASPARGRGLKLTPDASRLTMLLSPPASLQLDLDQGARRGGGA